MITITRTHYFDAGHRIFGHDGKCALVHGHGYTAHFTVTASRLDEVGRIIDFSVLNQRLCQWLENNWDHKLLLYEQDDLAKLTELPGTVVVPFNPTAENMADHLLRVVGPIELAGTRVRLVKVTIEETRKCSATVTL